MRRVPISGATAYGDRMGHAFFAMGGPFLKRW